MIFFHTVKMAMTLKDSNNTVILSPINPTMCENLEANRHLFIKQMYSL